MRTVVHLSDLHFGRNDPRLLPPLVRTINSISPDLIAVSGDLTQRAHRGQFAQAQAFLRQLPYCKIIVPGNHDVPLYNIAARFVCPLAAYQHYIEGNLEPVFVDDEIKVVGLNSSRPAMFRGGGKLSKPQIERAAARLGATGPAIVRIVVTHHPFDVPDGHDEDCLIGQSKMAMEQLSAAGVDVFLSGHLHLSHVGSTTDRYRIRGHAALVVQAGTMSQRWRGEPNSFNVVRVARPLITVDRYLWDNARQTFRISWSTTFESTTEGWTRGNQRRQHASEACTAAAPRPTAAYRRSPPA